jgi:phosphoribosylanthranilate isomerase
MKIKVCGMRDAQNIAEIAALPIDYMGFIFYEKSARHVDTESSTFLNYTNFKSIQKVGVFVNENIENIISKVFDYQLDVVQLHGGETNDFIFELKKKLPQIVVFKAISVAEESDFTKTTAYPDADFLLLDTKTPLHGGSGQKFDWSLLEKNPINKPFFLSGGIAFEDVEIINNLGINNLYGIDVNSRFEFVPALKDTLLLKNFIAKMI